MPVKKKKPKPLPILSPELPAQPKRTKILKGQLSTSDKAIETKKQHIKPCIDCPFARKALPRWLAGYSPGWWMRVAHGDGRMECHTRNEVGGKKAHQCAGAAIFRANVFKSPRDPAVMQLERDKTLVFANDREFRVHHEDPNPDANIYEDIPEDKLTDLLSDEDQEFLEKL